MKKELQIAEELVRKSEEHVKQAKKELIAALWGMAWGIIGGFMMGFFMARFF